MKDGDLPMIRYPAAKSSSSGFSRTMRHPADHWNLGCRQVTGRQGTKLRPTPFRASLDCRWERSTAGGGR